MPKTTLPRLKSLLLDPQADPLAVGLELAALTAGDLRRLGYGSLTQLIRDGLLAGRRSPGYTTVMSWVRAARFLDGPDDPRRQWGVSLLLEVGDLAASEQHRRVRERHGDGRTSVRAIRAAVGRRKAGDGDRRESPRPHAVLERAIQVALERQNDAQPSLTVHIGQGGRPMSQYSVSLTGRTIGPPLASALATASRVVDAITTAGRVWRHATPPDDDLASVPAPMPLDGILRLPPGQLGAHWEGPDVACVTKAGVPILRIPVRRVQRDSARLLSAQGNTKTRHAMPLIDCISDGCLRAATGWPGCDQACFTVPETNAKGCYSAYSRWACQDHVVDDVVVKYDLIRNGLINPLMRIRLPRNGSSVLSSVHGPRTWRVDCESADGAMSVSLGFLQTWAERNPKHRFFTIASHCFRPDDEMLCWASALRNLWVGHTVSAAFHETELGVRLAAIARFLEYRIPSVVWIVTHGGWDNEGVLRRVLELVPPERVIEAPLRHGTATQELPMLREHAVASCGDHRVADGISYCVTPRPDPYGGPRETFLVDYRGRQVSPVGKASRCLRCSIRCGEGCLETSSRRRH